jgi:amino acid transporter
MPTHDNFSGTTILRRPARSGVPVSWRTWLIGRPLPTADAPHQTISKRIGLAVFASDALSSTAYATQEIMVILAAAGTIALGYVFPISLAIVVLLAIVTFSYLQTVNAYPNGGGAYIVARDNLGQFPSLVAASALLTDYILTVAVSISSGVAQIVSAAPELAPYRVILAVFLVGLIMIINLRGVKESGTIFAIPTYFFVVMMFLTVGTGLVRYLTGTLGEVVDPPEMHTHGLVTAITPFLILHAFSSGTAALTGIEAISDGITAFRQPRGRNASITLVVMAFILASLFLGISFLVNPIAAVPSEDETVISQLARTVYESRGLLYLLTISATTVILIMAANTAFADFPRLSAIMAGDGFLPRQMAFRGSRLVFSTGIVALAFFASLLIAVFRASVTALIPLYAIGVFLSFTISQSGMARRWYKSGQLRPGETRQERGSILPHDPRWRVKMAINAFGAVCTAIVMSIFAVTKFVHGAWIVLVVIPLLVWMLLSVRRHYRVLAECLSLDRFGGPPPTTRHRVILPISGVHRGTLAALRYAHTLSDDITAVHVSVDPEAAEKLRQKWEIWGDGVRLVILESPYRTLVEPLLDYINEINARRQPNETITIVVPQFVPAKRWHNLLHTQTASVLRSVLLREPGIVVTEVPYLIEENIPVKDNSC